MESLAIVVLAAGLGKRLGGSVPKAATLVRGIPLITRVVNALVPVNPSKLVVVIGHGADAVKNCLSKHSVSFAIQDKQLGTGHAALMAEAELANFKGTILIAYGDMPLISPQTIAAILEQHQKTSATITFLTLNNNDNSFGRIHRDEHGRVKKIVEIKDCSPLERLINETNAGYFAVDSAFLFSALKRISNQNAQGEYQLTDLVELANQEGQRVETVRINNAWEVSGINTPEDLRSVNEHLIADEIKELAKKSVYFEDPHSVYFDPTVTFEEGVTVGPNVKLLGTVKIGAKTLIEGNAFIQNTTIGTACKLKWGLRIEDSTIGPDCEVGPFAVLRGGVVLTGQNTIGNFVEVKNSTLAVKACAKHLSYLGDGQVGAKTNIGAGTIFCNYDGFNKHKTTIGENVFVGSDSVLVAPVTIGDGALIAAGSVITQDVSANALALGRSPQVEKADYAKLRRDRLKK